MPPERLTRLDFVYERWPIYFVTACTANRRPLLSNDATHNEFKKFAATGIDRCAWIGRYVLMSDHFHLFVTLDEERLSLSQWVKSLKGTLSAQFRRLELSPPYWQKGFSDHVLRSERSYSEKWEYVCENPVRAGLVHLVAAWPYAGEINYF
ncbi:MAG TPA: transposase [Chthoniobacterales bacterium]|nr:transposase [Chthoniobacterales bacterium]